PRPETVRALAVALRAGGTVGAHPPARTTGGPAGVSCGPGPRASFESEQAFAERRRRLIEKGRRGSAFLAASRAGDGDPGEGLSAPGPGSRAARLSDLPASSPPVAPARERAQRRARAFGVAGQAGLEEAGLSEPAGSPLPAP